MKKETILILILAAIKFMLPFLLQNSAYELHRDEYLYYQQGQHLSLGFLENPPLIGVMGWISSLLGGSFFWIKFWPCLFGALTLVITAGIVKQLGGNLFALFVSALGILLSGYLRIHFLFQPNFLDVFFWTLSAYFLLQYINTGENKYLYFMSVALAFGWWGKYSVLFFAAAIVLSVLLTYHRKLFLNKHLWLAALLGLVLILPNIFWQYQHRWPLLHHMQELRETQLQYLNKADFIKEQFLMLLPVVFVWLSGLVWLLLNNKYRIVGLVYLICVCLIMLGSGKGYYTLGAYPMLLAAGGIALEKWSYRMIWLRYASLVLIFALFIPFLPLIMPLQEPEEMALTNEKYNLKKLGILRWEDLQDHALQQDFADMIGWRELSQKAERQYQSLSPEEQQQTIVYCRQYGQAGALNYYAKDKSFKDKIICDNGTFLLWIPELHFKHMIFIGGKIPESDDEVFQQFEKITVVDSVTNNLSRQYRDKIIFYENAKDSAWQLANKGIKEMKAVFGE